MVYSQLAWSQNPSLRKFKIPGMTLYSLIAYCQYPNSISRKNVPKKSIKERQFSRNSCKELLTRNKVNNKITSSANCGVNRVKAYSESTSFIGSPLQLKPEYAHPNAIIAKATQWLITPSCSQKLTVFNFFSNAIIFNSIASMLTTLFT